jgi:hypothetical protein
MPYRVAYVYPFEAIIVSACYRFQPVKTLMIVDGDIGEFSHVRDGLWFAMIRHCLFLVQRE